MSGKTELLPCPFCGGEAKRSSETFERTILSWVYCTNCGAAGGYRYTEAEAIAAWNQRHVETCENMREKFGYKRLFVCSECGVTFDPDCEINYCPSCGRKVVKQ